MEIRGILGCGAFDRTGWPEEACDLRLERGFCVAA